MVYYTENERIRRGWIGAYYLFLLLIGFSILVGPTGFGLPVLSIDGNRLKHHELATPYWGADPEDCISCHPDEYNNWSTTAHATHVVEANATHVRIGAFLEISYTIFNASCSQCHTTGWDDTGGIPTYDALGVNCFACHNTTSPYLDYSGNACATCHTGSSPAHPYQYAPWENSAHANSLTDLRTSGYASSDCMHCMSTEGFVDQEGYFDPEGDYNPVSCPACHSMHGNWSLSGPYMIRAMNATQLCGKCHTTTYTTWFGGTHHLMGLTCIDCHGYDLTDTLDVDTYFLNHTFVVKPDLACGQPNSGCHEDNLDWVLAQLEVIQDTFQSLADEIEIEATSLRTLILVYNISEEANHDLVIEVINVIDDVNTTISTMRNDGSFGFHDRMGILTALNEAYIDLLNAKAYFYEQSGTEILIVTVTETNTITETVTVTETVTEFLTTTVTQIVTMIVENMVLLSFSAVGGIVIGIFFGIIVARSR